MQFSNVAVLVLAGLLVAEAVPTPSKVDPTPVVEKDSRANLEDDKSLSVASETEESDDLLRSKKSSTTTFCVEIKPGADHAPVTVCEPKQIVVPVKTEVLFPPNPAPQIQYVPHPVPVKPPPPTYLIKEASCPCGMTSPSIVTIPYGTSLSSLNLKPVARSPVNPAMDYMLNDPRSLYGNFGEMRTFPETHVSYSAANSFPDPLRSGMNGAVFSQQYTQGNSPVNLNRDLQYGNPLLVRCSPNVTPFTQRDLQMFNGDQFRTSTGYEMPLQNDQQGLQPKNMDSSQQQMQWMDPRYQSPDGYARSTMPNVQPQGIIPKAQSGRMMGQPRSMDNNQNYEMSRTLGQQQQLPAGIYTRSQMAPSESSQAASQRVQNNADVRITPSDQRNMDRPYSPPASQQQHMTPTVYVNGQKVDTSQIQSASGTRVTASTNHGQQSAWSEAPTSLHQNVDTSKQTPIKSAPPPDAGAPAEQAFAEQNAGRGNAMGQSGGPQSVGMSRSERMMQRMRGSLGTQNPANQPFVSTAPRVPEEKSLTKCDAQQLQQPGKA